MEPLTSTATSSLVSKRRMEPIFSKPLRRLGRIRVSLRLEESMLARKPDRIFLQLMRAPADALSFSANLPASEPHSLVLSMTPSMRDMNSSSISDQHYVLVCGGDVKETQKLRGVAICQLVCICYSQKNLSAKMLIAIARTSKGMFFVTNIRFL